MLIQMQLQPLPSTQLQQFSDTLHNTHYTCCAQDFSIRQFNPKVQRFPHRVCDTCLSCSLSLSSVTPRALIPRTLHAACSSFAFRLSNPSSAIICRHKITIQMEIQSDTKPWGILACIHENEFNFLAKKPFKLCLKLHLLS